MQTFWKIVEHSTKFKCSCEKYHTKHIPITCTQSIFHLFFVYNANNIVVVMNFSWIEWAIVRRCYFLFYFSRFSSLFEIQWDFVAVRWKQVTHRIIYGYWIQCTVNPAHLFDCTCMQYYKTVSQSRHFEKSNMNKQNDSKRPEHVAGLFDPFLVRYTKNAWFIKSIPWLYILYVYAFMT